MFSRMLRIDPVECEFANDERWRLVGHLLRPLVCSAATLPAKDLQSLFLCSYPVFANGCPSNDVVLQKLGALSQLGRQHLLI